MRVTDFGTRGDVFGESGLGDVIRHDGAFRARRRLQDRSHNIFAVVSDVELKRIALNKLALAGVVWRYLVALAARIEHALTVKGTFNGIVFRSGGDVHEALRGKVCRLGDVFAQCELL